jgi:hypothetical protein
VRFPTSAQIVAVGAALGACAAPAAERAPSATPGVPTPALPPVAPGEQPTTSATPNAAPPAASPPTGSTAASGSSPSAAPAPSGPAPAPNEHHGPALPELSVKSFGLHIGGTKDAGARADFLRALEAASWRYLDCYRLVEEPGTVGTFGADLTIGDAGGKAKVKTTRTKLRGEKFQACMVHAFESVSFGRPPSGRSVVVSYSVKFNLSE